MHTGTLSHDQAYLSYVVSIYTLITTAEMYFSSKMCSGVLFFWFYVFWRLLFHPVNPKKFSVFFRAMLKIELLVKKVLLWKRYLWGPLPTLWTEIEIRVHWPSSMKFNSGELLFDAVFHIIGNFCCIWSWSEPIFPFLEH